MRIVIQIEVEVERIEGKFASKDDLADQIISELEGSDPGQLTGENEGEYEVTAWDVSRVSA